MPNQPSPWLQQYHQPFTRRSDVECLSGHIHRTNMPAAGLVLCRLSRASELELLLRFSSNTAQYPETYGFLGGTANSVHEEPLETACRQAHQKFDIDREEISPVGLEYKRDHGGVKYLTYTYVFAEYDSDRTEPPGPLTHASEYSTWCEFNNLPRNLMGFIKEDMKQIQHVLVVEVLPRLLEKQRMRRRSGSSRQAPVSLPIIKAEKGADDPVSDAGVHVSENPNEDIPVRSRPVYHLD